MSNNNDVKEEKKAVANFEKKLNAQETKMKDLKEELNSYQTKHFEDVEDIKRKMRETAEETSSIKKAKSIATGDPGITKKVLGYAGLLVTGGLITLAGVAIVNRDSDEIGVSPDTL